MSGRLRAAVVGVGYLGRFHALKYAMMPDVELVAVADIDAARARLVAAQSGTAWVTDHRYLLGDVDLVSVATPTAVHFPIARDFLAADAHVLVEKPIASTTAQAHELIALARRHDRTLQPGHIERFNPAWQAVVQRVGQPLLIRAHRLAPFASRGADISVVLDLMIHDLDLILSLVGVPPVKIQAHGTHVVTRNTDVCWARMEFGNGCVAEVVASRANARASRMMHIYQFDEHLSVDFRKQRFRARLRSPAPGQPVTLQQNDGPRSDALLSEIQAFLASVRTHAAPVVSGEDGLSALALALEIDRLSEDSRLGATG